MRRLVRLLPAFLLPALVRAQGPAERPIAIVADSVAGAGDTTAAIALLQQHLRRASGDASAWHRVGLLAWAKSRPARSTHFMSDQADVKRIRMADSALLLAHRLAPDSGRFALDLARFYMNSSFVQLRAQAYGLFDDAVDAGKRAHDSLLVAAALDEKGMVYWRRYEPVSYRAIVTEAASRDLSALASSPRDARDYLKQLAQPAGQGGDWPGQLDYFQASDAFKEALAWNPNDVRAWKHAYMVLGERGRWEELRSMAKARLSAAPWDPYAWLARALASHRINDEGDATAAFDSAMTFLSPDERGRYTRLSRILRPGQRRDAGFGSAAAYDSAPAAQRARADALYWQLADPLVLTPENEHRLEFLARVAFAELRWTSDDFDVHGADSDRGDIFVRYGPPDQIIGLPPDPQRSTVTHVWLYDAGLIFSFDERITYGTGHIADGSQQFAEGVKDRTPVSWDNLPTSHDIDTIPVLATRFRSASLTPDSLDMVLVAQVPVDSLTRGVDLRRPAIDVDLHVYSASATVLRRDSTRFRVGETAEDSAARVRVWREALPRSAQLWRIEALQPDARHAARALGAIAGAPATGFALSDLLVATRVLPREGTAGERWRDFAIVPNVGRFHRGDPVALLWETYDLARNAEGSSHYRVQVTLEKVKRQGALGIAARVLGGAGGVVGLQASGKGKVSLGFDRTIAARPAVTDYLTLDLGDAPAGDWTLTVEVNDRTTGKTARSQRVIRIE